MKYQQILYRAVYAFEKNPASPEGPMRCVYAYPEPWGRVEFRGKRAFVCRDGGRRIPLRRAAVPLLLLYPDGSTREVERPDLRRCLGEEPEWPRVLLAPSAAGEK